MTTRSTERRQECLRHIFPKDCDCNKESSEERRQECLRHIFPQHCDCNNESSVEQTFLSASSTPSLHSPSDIPSNMTHRRLPHWTSEAVVYWITFRLADSLPQEKLNQWREERDIWLQHNAEPWDDQQWREYNCRFGDRLDQWLDAGHGSRPLARPDVQMAVRECLTRFDGERLQLHAAVIMPNHVHLLMQPLGENRLPELMRGIKGASARKANMIIGKCGQFWLDESFDHIVRSEPQYQHFVRYIADNPVKAGLKEHEYWLYQNTLSIDDGQTGMSTQHSMNNEQTRMSTPHSVNNGQTGMSTQHSVNNRQTGMSTSHLPEK